MRYVLSACILFGMCLDPVSANNPITISDHLSELLNQVTAIETKYNRERLFLAKKIREAKQSLIQSTRLEDQVYWLKELEFLRNEKDKMDLNEGSEISKVRYLKGLQIIKLLYEKTLALDHHFSSVNTLNEINQMANPNKYPEYVKVKDQLTSKQDKKSKIDFGELLGSNIYTATIHSLFSLFSNDATNQEFKENSLRQIECILDFTLRMHNDLTTIYFETKFLEKSNENMMKEIQQLFVDYTKPIKYLNTLSECRNTDDWDSVRDKLNTYLDILNRTLLDNDQIRKAHRMQIDLEFPIDRLLQFITQYNSFINQGSKFYEKFGIMLASYENKNLCKNTIPQDFQKLKADINVAILKFNTAYKPIEINGSKMKEVLYGINEYN